MARDEILKLKGKEGFFVVNLHSSQKSGSHWVTFKVGRKESEYFDSYGLQPTQEFISLVGKNYIFSHSQYQTNESVTCGLFVTYWIYRRLKGVSYYNALSDLSIRNPYKNEAFISNWFEKKLVR